MNDYSSIIEVLLSDEVGNLVPEGVAHSFPVLSRDPFGNLIDCFFLYEIDLITGEDFPPYARVGIYTEHRRVAFYQTAKEIPFSKTAVKKSTSSIREKDILDYERLYPLIRSFAFDTDLDSDQTSLLTDYLNTSSLLFGEQMQYYRDIASPFFRWIEESASRSVPKMTFIDACLEGDAELGDIHLYNTGKDETELRRNLGMTDEEFSAWRQYGNKVLRDILFCRMNGRPFEYLTDDEKIAARSYDPSAIDKLKNEESQ